MRRNDAKNTDQPALWEVAEPSPPRPTREQTPAADRVVEPTSGHELWDIDDVAGYLGVPKQTIYRWRSTGYGPPGFRVGKHLRWRRATVLAWITGLEDGRGR